MKLTETDLITNSEKKLVEYFVLSRRAEKLRAISSSVSPDFIFSSPRVKAYNFAQYCEHIENLSFHAEMKIVEFEKIGEVYVIDEIFQIVDTQRRYFDVMKRKVFVGITDGLIQSVKVVYDITPEEKTYLDEVYPISEEFKP